MHLTDTILSTIAPIAFAITIIFGNFLVLLHDEGFFYAEFERYGVHEQLPSIDVSSMHDRVIDFLEGERKELPYDFFNKRERDHMDDVKKMIFGVAISFWIAIFLLSAIIFYFLYQKKTEKNRPARKIAHILSRGSFLALIICLIVGFFALTSFGNFFERFHQIFLMKDRISLIQILKK